MWKALIKLVEKWACRHEWQVLENWIEEEYRGRFSYSYDVTLYVCKKCGKMKRV